MLSFVLLLISIPLVYTLSRGVSEIKFKKNIETSLKQQFNQEKRSRLVTFHLGKLEGDLLEIDAVVNTVNYLKDTELEQAEQKIQTILKRKVRLSVEQVKVLPQGLIEKEAKAKPALVPFRPAKEILLEARDGVLAPIRNVCAQAEEVISPSRIINVSVAFQDKTSTLLLTLKIRRDSPLSTEELVWLEKFFSSSLDLPLRLRVETAPFVSPLIFEAGSVNLTEAMKKDLEPLREAYVRNDRICLSLETVSEATLPYKERVRLASERADVLAAFLRTEYRIPPAQIRKTLAAKAARSPSIKVTLSTLPGREQTQVETSR